MKRFFTRPDPLKLGIIEQYVTHDSDLFIKITQVLRCTTPVTQDVFYAKVRKVRYIIGPKVTPLRKVNGLILKTSWCVRVPAPDSTFVGPLLPPRAIPGSLAKDYKIELDRPNGYILHGVLVVYRDEYKIEIDLTGHIKRMTLHLMKTYK
jgi:hypothetical protein